MSTSLLLLALGAGAGTMTGIVLYRALAARKRYFSELARFIDYVISDLKYRRTDVVTLRGGFVSADDALSTNLDEWLNGLESGQRKLTCGKLKKTEVNEVEAILFGVGQVDLESQLFELAAAKEKVAAMQVAAQQRLDKYGALYIKLGLLAGLALGILLM